MSRRYEAQAYSVISVMRFNIMMILCLYTLNVASAENFKERTIWLIRTSMAFVYLMFLIYAAWAGDKVDGYLSNSVLQLEQLCICWEHLSLKWVEVIFVCIFVMFSVLLSIRIEHNFKKKLYKVNVSINLQIKK